MKSNYMSIVTNIIIWPAIIIAVIFSAKLAGQISWDEVVKILPVIGIISILFTAALFTTSFWIRQKHDLISMHRRDVQSLQRLLRNQPMPSARTGHENLGNPSSSAYIMGAIPKRDVKSRIALFFKNMSKGVTYRFLYLDEPGTRAGILAYCRELMDTVNHKQKTKRGTNVLVEQDFQLKIVPIETIQMSFDIFDSETDEARMLIHFPNFGALSGELYNQGWEIHCGNVIQHYSGIFQHIWEGAGQILNVSESAKQNKLVFTV